MTFKNIPYKQYKSSFLSIVTLSLKFDANEALSDAKFVSNLKEYVDSSFSLHINEADEFNGLTVKSVDGNFTYSFGKTGVGVEILGDGYQNFFNSQNPCLLRMVDYVKNVVEFEGVKEIAVRKVNKWHFKNNSQKTVSVDEARDFVFSPEFLNVLSSDNLSDVERLVDNFEKVEEVVDGKSVSLRTAYLKDSKDANITGLILDSVCRQIAECIKLDDLQNVCKGINKLLFDAFHWCVKQQIISMMEE